MAENSQNLKKKSSLKEFERIPRCYKQAEKVLHKFKAGKDSLKTVMCNSGHRGVEFKIVYTLARNVLKYRYVLQEVIKETNLPKKVPFLQKEFAGILIYELIIGKGLPGKSRPVLAIRKHEKEIREAFDIVRKDVNLSSTGLKSLPHQATVNTLATSVPAVLEDLKSNGIQEVHSDKNTSLDGMAGNSQNLKKKSSLKEFDTFRCYEQAERVLHKVKAGKDSLKTIMYKSRHRGVEFKIVYSLARNVLKYRHVLQEVIKETNLPKKVPFLRKEFAGILIYELIIGKGLPGESRPVLAIRKHEKEIREAFDIARKDVNLSSTGLKSLPRQTRVNTLATSVSPVLEDLKNNGIQEVHSDKNTSLDGMAENSQNLKKKSFVKEFERVPPYYKEAEKVLTAVEASKGSLKTIMFNLRHRREKRVYSLVSNVLKHRPVLEKVIEETDLLIKVPFLRKEFALILIHELIIGKGLPGESRPVLAIRKHVKEIREAYDIARKEVNGLMSLPCYARVNTLTTSVSAVLEDLKKKRIKQVHYDENTSLDEYMNLVKNLKVGYYMIDFHFKDLLVFASKSKLPKWQLYQKRHIVIQDKSSYIPVHVLDPKPGDTVLDACAAPGMKTLHIAAAMKNEGKIYAYDKDEKRFETLKTILDRGNIEICEANCEDFYLVNTKNPQFRSVEYILVDPSCSGSGMGSRMDSVTDTVDSKNKQRLEKLAGFQILLLKHALLFPSVKRVVYSTCSVTEEENEYVVHEVLKKYGNRFKLVSVMPDWPIRGSDKFEYGHLCLRAHPDVSLTNGFFVAMFERLESDNNLEMNTRESKKCKNEENCSDDEQNCSDDEENCSDDEQNCTDDEENCSDDEENCSDDEEL